MKSYFRERFLDWIDEPGHTRLGSNTYVRSELYEQSATNDFEADFSVWIDERRSEAREEVKQLLSRNSCLARFNRLIERHESSQVLPFVGAGMSEPSGFPMWQDFLKEISRDGGGPLMLKVLGALRAYQFEEAAQIIADNLGENILNEHLDNHFGASNPTVVGPVALLPFIFRTGCVTTNFDNVLEGVFSAEDAPFKTSFQGREVLDAPKRSANSEHVLFKLHGGADGAGGRILTSSDYSAAYGNSGTHVELINYLISNRNLLFMGCSLSVDRTINALRKIKVQTKLHLPRHYAFVPDPRDSAKRAARRQELDSAEIHPIWYPVEQKGDHNAWIEKFLLAMDGGAL